MVSLDELVAFLDEELKTSSISDYPGAMNGLQLANGGQVLLGYRRDKKHKGRLIVDETEAEVVRAVFRTYLREKTIRRTTKRIKERSGWLTI